MNPSKKNHCSKDFNEQCFKDYIQHGFKESEEGGVELAFSKEIEYQCFCSTPYYYGDTQLKRPTHFIHATKGVMGAKDLQDLKRIFAPKASFTSFEGGHLFPLEKPKKTVHLLQSMINN